MNQATYNREPWERTKTALAVTGQALLLLFFAAVMYAYLLIAAALSEPQTTETRCFQTAAQGTYCRTQNTWGIDE